MEPTESQTGGLEPGEPRLSGRQRRLLAGVVAGKTTRQAAVEAGFSEETARSGYGSKVLRIPAIRSALADAMRRKGLTVSKIAGRLNEALDATRGEFYKGRSVPSDLPDHRIRVEACHLSAQLYGQLPRGADIPEPQPPPVQITIIERGAKEPAPREPGQGLPAVLPEPDRSNPVQIFIVERKGP